MEVNQRMSRWFAQYLFKTKKTNLNNTIKKFCKTKQKKAKQDSKKTEQQTNIIKKTTQVWVKTSSNMDIQLKVFSEDEL